MASIIYLHGFHSSPLSEKAVQFNQFMKLHHPDIKVYTPQLHVHPQQAISEVETLVESIKQTNDFELIGIVGSSLGGFISTYIHNKYNVPAVVINPAVKPFELLEDYVGKQVQPITGEEYLLEPHHMDELKAIYQPTLHDSSKVWCLQQEGDEVLDYRQAAEHYQLAKMTLEPGGNHSFIGFKRYLPQIVDFFL
ncbi:esterase YqiA [Psychrosphaera haliotis]|uniref:YqiA/YcfP family alpha/beta fold hydrolase n=1 Tax=Psychrosphaera haliotis TaxID=555083 RepID=UPI0031E1E16C